MDCFGWYGGANFGPHDNILLSVAYSFEQITYNDAIAYGPESSFITYYSLLKSQIHTLISSFEYTILTPHVIDFFIVRGGLSWSLTNSNYDEQSDSSGLTSRFTVRYPEKASNMVPTIGFGIGWAGVHFDIASSLGEWVSALAGPPVVTTTITIYFDEMGKKTKPIAHSTSPLPATLYSYRR